MEQEKVAVVGGGQTKDEMLRELLSEATEIIRDEQEQDVTEEDLEKAFELFKNLMTPNTATKPKRDKAKAKKKRKQAKKSRKQNR
jgi:hypothetical protein